uniref:Uncharacterized protein n=1 Tax=Ditylenchus dipsaci TaxID=166011 RepID=A0A915CWG4_9BILA
MDDMDYTPKLRLARSLADSRLLVRAVLRSRWLRAEGAKCPCTTIITNNAYSNHYHQQQHYPLPPQPHYGHTSSPGGSTINHGYVGSNGCMESYAGGRPPPPAYRNHPEALEGQRGEQRHLQPPPKFTPIQKVQHWTQNSSQFDSGVQSMSQSSATSLMSSIHAGSQISTVSSLPDQCQELSEQQMARFQNIPSSFHPADRENVRRALPELIPLLTDNEEEVVCKALDIVQKIAKFDSDNLYLASEPLIREQRIIDGLLHALKTHRNNKKITRLALCTLFHISSNRRHGLDLIIQTIEKKGTKCLDDLLHCISVQEHSCFKYAFLILHNLMTEPKIARQVIQHVRELKTLTQIVGWLGEKNEKLMAIIVDIIQLLVDRNSEQKSFFLSLNGPNRLIKIIASAQYENLLSRATKLLKYISICDPKKIVDAGALEVLHVHLNHASQRLVRDLLVCIRDLSDVPTKDHDLTPLLEKLLQLLGTNDLHIKQLCTQILANLSANNKPNKEFLTEAYLDAIRSRQSTSLNGQLLEDIQDNSLGILRSVCTGHDSAIQAQCEIMAKRPTDIILQKLVQKRVVLLRKTLRILSVTATQDANLPRFREVFKRHPNETRVVVPYVHEIVQAFHIAASQLPTMPVVEDVSVAELMQTSMNILQSLCRDDFLLKKIFESLKEFPAELPNGSAILLPQLALRDDELAHRAILLLAELARIPEAAHMLSMDSLTLDILRNWARSKTQIASSAVQVLEFIEQGGDVTVATKQQHISPNYNKQPDHLSSPISSNSQAAPYCSPSPSHYIMLSPTSQTIHPPDQQPQHQYLPNHNNMMAVDTSYHQAQPPMEYSLQVFGGPARAWL